jgi:hypothetical protein
MTLPSIQLRQNADVDDAIQTLRILVTNFPNDARNPTLRGPAGFQDAYVRASGNAEGLLGSFLSSRDAAALFDGPRHRDICSMTPGQHLVRLINDEINAQSVRFAAQADELERARGLFSGTCLVPDTTFYIHHGKKLDEVDDFHELANDIHDVRVLIPMVVVDELDNLKQSKNRGRANVSLAVIDRVVLDPPAPGRLIDSTFGTSAPNPRGAVTLQIVFDPPGHRRLPINDDEIVDRCVALSPFVDTLTVVTYDTGQSTRAQAAGVKAIKLPHPVDPEAT